MSLSSVAAVALRARALAELGALLGEVPGQLGVDVLEERVERGRLRALGLRDGGADLGVDLDLDRLLLLLGEARRALEVLAQARDRIEALPRVEPRVGAVRLRVVARGVARNAVRHALDERRAL